MTPFAKYWTLCVEWRHEKHVAKGNERIHRHKTQGVCPSGTSKANAHPPTMSLPERPAAPRITRSATAMALFLSPAFSYALPAQRRARQQSSPPERPDANASYAFAAGIHFFCLYKASASASVVDTAANTPSGTQSINIENSSDRVIQTYSSHERLFFNISASICLATSFAGIRVMCELIDTFMLFLAKI